ncbi:50S ribosomal protein L6 [candidate division WOR-1 bacterium RIFOXYB2_FULL_42_35]|uniref:Large ribosomal subunit protein uL6 n=1 Tax=candidate division WOR-1 bacterium RIFOXYC2_FULL_41_25 TaxID=1802586 RepID=A0A1F4TNU2_UNCSA|nr:MAG: 50S ribosomal protein L6 [candidate division WOR-1 bacterium RIFOXYA2_FULL_41_14]OGC23868.1 MAG: 50S ribosomal protein L6 [candidate division WOR-1 bacterium RIFOXYB2_FULL_42_35]OGC33743.1 MAG: 50S ribosomal protein L6 [candidate division WOR-1 bacterium RIFOXYC2_FULL_41_25]
MGKIGKRILQIPQGVEVKVADGKVIVKGPKGTLEQKYLPQIKVEVKDKTVVTLILSGDPKANALQGLYNSLISSMIEGVTKGFEKKLEMVGVGYRVAKQGSGLQLQIGFSHPVDFAAPPGIVFDTEGTNKIIIKGMDKQLVGEMAAEIRMTRKPEPYKGKGIRYVGEIVRKKAGKAAKAAGGA